MRMNAIQSKETRVKSYMSYHVWCWHSNLRSVFIQGTSKIPLIIFKWIESSKKYRLKLILAKGMGKLKLACIWTRNGGNEIVFLLCLVWRMRKISILKRLQIVQKLQRQLGSLNTHLSRAVWLFLDEKEARGMHMVEIPYDLTIDLDERHRLKSFES